ncbi:major facilitator superfamily transporter, partial [Colletotrichum orchidophilum]
SLIQDCLAKQSNAVNKTTHRHPFQIETNAVHGDSTGVQTHTNTARQPAMAEAKVTWASLPRKDQLVILFLVRFCEPIVKVSISSYVYFQLQSLDPSLPSATIVQQTTLLQAAYTVAQSLASVFLGSVADSPRGGRKVVIVLSLLGSFVACSLFGFVANFKQALVLRFVEGLTNGNVAMVRTMTSEVVQEKKFQARAFVLLNISTSFAIILSALVAAGTVELTPKGHGSGLLARYPYALPALLNASFLLVVLVTTVLFLEETSKLVRHRYDPGIALSRYLVSRFQSLRNGTSKEALYAPVNATEEMAFLDEQEPEAASPPPKPIKPVVCLPTTRIFTKNMVLVLLAAFIYEAHLATASVAFPNLLVTPVSSREEEAQRVLPFFFGGGVGFTPLPLAVYSVMYGIFSIPLQLILYPRLSQRLGPLHVWRIFYLAFPLLYYAYPFVALVPSSSPPPSGKTGLAIWAVITPMQVLTALLTSTVTPSQTVLINAACPHPSALARTHSIAYFSSMVTRAGSTALAGALLGPQSPSTTHRQTHPKMARFTSKIILVTSCASGSGAAIVRRLASEGATVIAADKSGHEELAAELGASVIPRHLDAASEDSIRDLETYIRTTHGRLDILVNNTGMGGPRCPILDVQAADAEEVFRYNIHGAFLILQLALRFMTEQQQPTGGSIVLTASIAGLIGTPHSAPYAISKGAVIAMTKTAAVEYAKHGIRVNAVAPGPTVVPMVEALGAAATAGFRARIPQARLAEPREVAGVVAFLADGDDAGHVTGQVLCVDGGWTAA